MYPPSNNRLEHQDSGEKCRVSGVRRSPAGRSIGGKLGSQQRFSKGGGGNVGNCGGGPAVLPYPHTVIQSKGYRGPKLRPTCHQVPNGKYGKAGMLT